MTYHTDWDVWGRCGPGHLDLLLASLPCEFGDWVEIQHKS